MHVPGHYEFSPSDPATWAQSGYLSPTSVAGAAFLASREGQTFLSTAEGATWLGTQYGRLYLRGGGSVPTNAGSLPGATVASSLGRVAGARDSWGGINPLYLLGAGLLVLLIFFKK